MMKKTRLIWLSAFLLAVVFSTANADRIRVITDRTESHLTPLFKHFEETTGIEIEAVFVNKGLLPRMKARPTEADVVITKTLENMEQARKADLLQPFESDVLSGLKDEFKDKDNEYFVVSYRARGFYISKDEDRVSPSELKDYMDLIKPKFKGRVAIRSGYHDYNISLFCQMAEVYGLEQTEKFIKGLKANLARTPQGNDRAQIKAIHDGKADISVGNSYYYAIMMNRDDQRAWAESVNFIFPGQSGKGTFVLRAGAGLTRSKRNVEDATKLLEYLTGDFAQYYLTSTLHVYSIKDQLPISTTNHELGKVQPEVEEGRFKPLFVPARSIDKHRPKVIGILNKVNFDQ